MLKILRNNGYKCKHIHITILRDPLDRLISRFFQCFHNDEVHCMRKKHMNTVMNNDVKTLVAMFQKINTWLTNIF